MLKWDRNTSGGLINLRQGKGGKAARDCLGKTLHRSGHPCQAEDPDKPLLCPTVKALSTHSTGTCAQKTLLSWLRAQLTAGTRAQRAARGSMHTLPTKTAQGCRSSVHQLHDITPGTVFCSWKQWFCSLHIETSCYKTEKSIHQEQDHPSRSALQ